MDVDGQGTVSESELQEGLFVWLGVRLDKNGYRRLTEGLRNPQGELDREQFQQVPREGRRARTDRAGRRGLAGEERGGGGVDRAAIPSSRGL